MDTRRALVAFFGWWAFALAFAGVMAALQADPLLTMFIGVLAGSASALFALDWYDR